MFQKQSDPRRPIDDLERYHQRPPVHEFAAKTTHSLPGFGTLPLDAWGICRDRHDHSFLTALTPTQDIWVSVKHGAFEKGHLERKNF